MRLLILLLIATATGWASVGNITETRQQTGVIRRQNQTLPGNRGASLEMKDVIKTGAGVVGVTFADNTQMQVTENSQLLIDEFVYDPNNKGSGRLAMKVALGTVRYASGAIAKNDPSKVNIRTPTATVGVRGTDFMSVVDELGRSTIVLLPSCPAGWTDVVKDCVTGAVNVSTEVASVFMNRPFQATFVSNSNLAPSAPVILNMAEDSIRNLLIVNQPPALRAAVQTNENRTSNPLDVDPLATTALKNMLDADAASHALDQDLLPNVLDQDFVSNVVKRVQKQISPAAKVQVQVAVTAPADATPAAESPANTSANTSASAPDDSLTASPAANSESATLFSHADDHNNIAVIYRDGVHTAQIGITQWDGSTVTNTINNGVGTTITVRQR